MSKILTLAEIEPILRAVPGAANAEITTYDVGPFMAITWRDMAALLARVPVPPVGYLAEAFDCDKFTGWTWAHANALWAAQCLKAGQGKILPLAGGVLCGNVPLDGNSHEDGWHSLCWFIDDESKFQLYGAQERAVFSPFVVADIEEVDEFTLGK